VRLVERRQVQGAHGVPVGNQPPREGQTEKPGPPGDRPAHPADVTAKLVTPCYLPCERLAQPHPALVTQCYLALGAAGNRPGSPPGARSPAQLPPRRGGSASVGRRPPGGRAAAAPRSGGRRPTRAPGRPARACSAPPAR